MVSLILIAIRTAIPTRSGANRHDIHGFRMRIKDQLRFATIKLAHDGGNFLFQRDIVLTVLGALTQYKGFHHAAQRAGG